MPLILETSRWVSQSLRLCHIDCPTVSKCLSHLSHLPGCVPEGALVELGMINDLKCFKRSPAPFYLQKRSPGKFIEIYTNSGAIIPNAHPKCPLSAPMTAYFWWRIYAPLGVSELSKDYIPGYHRQSIYHPWGRDMHGNIPCIPLVLITFLMNLA